MLVVSTGPAYLPLTRFSTPSTKAHTVDMSRVWGGMGKGGMLDRDRQLTRMTAAHLPPGRGIMSK